MQPEITLKGGFKTADPRLDRIPQFDVASRGFQVRQRLETVPLPRREKSTSLWRPAPGVDQLREGACVWAAKIHRINGSPHRRKPPLGYNDMIRLYWETQKIDEWPGGSYPGASPTYGGTSVLAGCKVALREGFITRYEWVGAGSGDVGADVVDTLHWISGINFGVGWTESMFYPRPSGLLDVEGPFVGGHAVYGFQHAWRGRLRGEGTKPVDVVWLQQSWGADHGVSRYGIAGCVAIRTEDLVNKLLLNDGPWRGEGAVLLEAA